MAIFADNDQISSSGASTTIIAKGTKLKGELDLKSDLHVDGELDGIVRSSSSVSVGSSGLIKGEVFAKRFMISGKFVGTTDSDVVEILPKGRIDGKIIYQELIVEKQGFFSGESRIRGDVDHKKETVGSSKSVSEAKKEK